jgi:uncharacterized membrane protein YhfC
MKSFDDYTIIGALALVLLIMIAGAWWWLPQKWQACQKLYDNRPAQIICMGSK